MGWGGLGCWCARSIWVGREVRRNGVQGSPEELAHLSLAGAAASRRDLRRGRLRSPTPPSLTPPPHPPQHPYNKSKGVGKGVGEGRGRGTK